MADRFFAPDLDVNADRLELVDAEAHHLATVRRHVGDEIVVFNGRGLQCRATIAEMTKRRVYLRVTACEMTPSLPACTLAAALPKGDRATLLIEKCVELGVTRFIPLSTERSVTHPREAKVLRFERTVIEACKQCGRNELMTIDPLTTLDQVLSGFQGSRWLMDPTGDAQGWGKLGDEPIIAIGPEGGWTLGELELAKSHGWSLISLPGSILRVETAVIAAASAVVLSRCS